MLPPDPPAAPVRLAAVFTPEELLGNLDGPLPLYLHRVPAGFPSPADDHLDRNLDLHAHLVRNPASTFFARAEGCSMTGRGIHDGDLLVIDRSVEPRNGHVVVAVINGEMTLKEYKRIGRRLYLLAANDLFAPRELLDGEECLVWGVVTHVIHAV